jgi:hypothetical protein
MKLVFVTMHASTAYLKAAFEAGGTGYVLKSGLRDQLPDAVQSVLGGRTYVSHELSTEFAERLQDPTRGPPLFVAAYARVRRCVSSLKLPPAWLRLGIISTRHETQPYYFRHRAQSSCPWPFTSLLNTSLRNNPVATLSPSPEDNLKNPSPNDWLMYNRHLRGAALLAAAADQ